MFVYLNLCDDGEFSLVPGKIANGHASNESLKDKLLEVQRDKKELGRYIEVEQINWVCNLFVIIDLCWTLTSSSMADCST